MANCPSCLAIPVPSGHVYCRLNCKRDHVWRHRYLVGTLAGGAIDTHPLTAGLITTLTAERDAIVATLGQATSSDGTEPW